MSHKTRLIFRFIWRTNAILISLAALMVIVTVGWLIIDELFDNLQRSDVASQPLIDDPSIAKHPLRLRSFTVIEGTGTGRADLITERTTNSGISSSGGTYDETHNVLWIDLIDGKGRWLLPNHKNIITFSEDVAISKEDSEGAASKPIAALFLVKEDVPEIDSSSGQLIITSLGGEQQKVVASDVRNVEGWDLINPNEVVIVYVSNSGYRLLTVDLALLQKIRETDLDIPK